MMSSSRAINVTTLITIMMIFCCVFFTPSSSSQSLFVSAQTTTDTPTTTLPPPTTTTSSTAGNNSSSNSGSSSDDNNNTNDSNETSPPASEIRYGNGIELQLNLSTNPDANKCMSLNSDLKHPDLKTPGANVRDPLCIPTNINKTLGWRLASGTGTKNELPTNDEIDNCVATCAMDTKTKQRASTVTVIHFFGHCYCWDQDFHDETEDSPAEKEAKEQCCKKDLVYEDYFLNSRCIDKMYGNVFVTSLLCPLNVSLCSSTLAKENCETTATVLEGTGENIQCCIPEGSLYSPPTWGLQVAQYTIIIICVLALFQILYWIFRKKREDEEEHEEERRREEQPRLLIVPTVMTDSAAGDSSPASPTETQTITQVGLGDTHAIHAAKEIVKLYKVLERNELDDLEGSGQEDCSICIDPLKNHSSPSVKTPCQHMFHKSCLFQYIAHKLRDRVRNVTCPVCRAVLVDASVNDEQEEGGGAAAAGSSSSSPTTNNITASPSRTSPSRSRNGRTSSSRGGNRGDSSSSSANDTTNPLFTSLLSLENRNNSNDDQQGVEMTDTRGNRRGRGSSRSGAGGSSGLVQSPTTSQYTPRGASALL